jgi:hypothetical protein
MYCSYSLGLLTVMLLQLQQYISAQTVSLSKAKYKFDEKISVTWELSGYDPENNYLSIFHMDVADDEDEAMYGYLCTGTQESGVVDGCDGSKTGDTIDFYATDPALEYDEQWPLNPGQYRACLRFSGNINLACEQFTISAIPSDAAPYTALYPLKKTYKYGTPIKGRFYFPFTYTNTWVGLYRANDASHSSSEIEEPLMWLYTGCNNQEGNQKETNDCSKKKRKGNFQFDEKVEDRSELYFAEIIAGNYRFCISYLNNSPYVTFACSDKFAVK